MSKHSEWINALLRLAADPAASAEKRLYAAEHLVRAGRFAATEPLLEVLAALPATARQARRLLAVSRQLQRWGIVGELEVYTGRFAAEPVDPASVGDTSVMVARRPGARRAIFVFTGAAKQIWVAIHLFHQLLPADCHVVFLQDPRMASFTMGIDALGRGYGATLEAMRELLASLGQPTLYCTGSSLGGYGALRYGLDLGARRVLAFSPTTDLSASVPRRPELERLQGIPPADSATLWPPGNADLLALYRAAGSYPEATIAFGGGNARDTAEARHIAVLPRVTLCELVGYEQHDVVAELIANGEIRKLIDRFLAP